jgi:hypothetical protein
MRLAGVVQFVQRGLGTQAHANRQAWPGRNQPFEIEPS